MYKLRKYTKTIFNKKNNKSNKHKFAKQKNRKLNQLLIQLTNTKKNRHSMSEQ